jgi:hypothetical protein
MLLFGMIVQLWQIQGGLFLYRRVQLSCFTSCFIAYSKLE